MKFLNSVTAFVLGVYAQLKPYGKLTAFLLALFTAVCATSTFRLGIREDISALIPANPPELSQRFIYLQRAPFMSLLTVAVRCEGHSPESLAEQLAEALKAEDPSLLVYTGPQKAFSVKNISHLCSLAPNLLTPEGLNGLETLLDPGYVEKALARDVRMLISPEGLAFRDLIALDPLGICPMLLAPMQKTGVANGVHVRHGYFTDNMGRYALLLIHPQSPMTDSTAASALMEAIDRAIASLPEGTKSFISGSYRHSAVNAQIVKEDLARVLPVSSLLIVLLFLLFIRKRQALSLLLVPSAAFALAGACVAVLLGGLSGIVVGFGSVLLGITADYAIHTYFSVSGAHSVEEGLKGVLPPLAAAMGTTSLAFAVLLFSSIPAIRQMALFALVGVTGAFIFSLFFLPLLLTPGTLNSMKSPKRGTATLRTLPATGLAVFFLLIIVLAFACIRTDGDIRNLAYAPQELRHDEEAIRGIHRTNGLSLIVAPGNGPVTGLDMALVVNDAVYGILRQAEEVPEESIVSIAPIFPSARKQEQARALWREFWQANTIEISQNVQKTAEDLGFAAEAFAPFKAWISNTPEAIGIELLRSSGLGFLLDISLSQTADNTLVYTTLAADVDLSPQTMQALADAGACIISPSSFREDMEQASGRDILIFCSFTLFAVILSACIAVRGAVKSLAVLLPTLAGFTLVLILFHCTGTAVNLFHGAALPLVIALSVDYGIFMLAVLEGKLGSEGKKAVLFSGLTTLAGFGCLLLARHPALFSLGFVVSGGIGASLVMAIWGLPLLVKPERMRAS